MKVLQPILLPESKVESLEKTIQLYFKELFGKLLYKTFGKEMKLNAKISVIEEALDKGTIEYEKGKFTGKFNASISRELLKIGAKYNKTQKAYIIEQTKLPFNLSQKIAEIRIRTRESYNNLVNALDSYIFEMRNQDQIKQEYREIIEALDREYKYTVKEEDIGIVPTLTIKNKEDIVNNYTENMELYVKDFTNNMIVDMRKKLEKDILMQGLRAETIKKRLMADYGISLKKAKFLARQESSLLTSQYRQSRYEDAGMPEYQWSTSHDSRVRDDHADLNQKIFRWDNPPIINQQTGKRGNPGEDYGCRCVAKPVLK